MKGGRRFRSALLGVALMLALASAPIAKAASGQESPSLTPPASAPASPPRKAAPALAAPQGPADAVVAAGLELLGQGNLQGAGEQFEKALALDPNHEVARSRLAYVRFRRADYSGAATSAEAATRLDPADSLAYLIVGRSKEALGDREGAHAAYTSAADLTLGATTEERLVASALGHYLRAMQHIQQAEYEDVRSDLKEVMRVYPKNGYARYEDALALLKSGKADEAVGAFSEAEGAIAAFHPSESWVYPVRRYFFLESNVQFWRGVALRQSGRLDEAVAVLESILPKVENMAGATTTPRGSPAAIVLEGKLETSFFGAHYEAALVYEAKGDKSKALAFVKRYLKLNLPDPDTLQRVRELQKRLK